jgi:conjugal transfer ATP-binding protein TraC
MIGVPVRVAARRPRQLHEGPTAVCLETGALGFLGASEEDRSRWLNAFRHLLDGLETALQVVIRFQPGSASQPASIGGRPGPTTQQQMRLLDLDHVSQLRQQPGAQARSVLIAVAADHADGVRVALNEMGVPDVRPLDGRQLRATYGRERPTAFLDSFGWHRSWLLNRYPGTDLEPGWLLKLVPPKLNVTLSWHAHPLPAAWIIEYLQRQLIAMRATRMHDADSGATDPLLAGAMPTTEDLQKRLAANQERAFHVSLYLTLSTPNAEVLEAGSRHVEAAAQAALSRLLPCTFRQFDGRLCTLPYGIDALKRCKVLDTSSLATFFPWLDADIQEQNGVVLGRSRATGAPVVVNPFLQPRYANANIGVFGHSGAGKTYLLSTLAMGALGLGVQVLIFDPEHEYGRLGSRLGGVDIQFALGSGHALNVLDLRPADGVGEAWLGPAVADAGDLIAVVTGGLDQAERGKAEAALRRAYAELEQPVLKDVVERLDPGSRLEQVLRRWVEGGLGAMFSAPTNVDLEAPIVVFGMRELRDELVPAVHFLLAHALWSRIKSRRRRRMLIVDELGLLFDDPTIRRFVVGLARRIRKYDGSLVFATQNPGDLLSSDAGLVVATNPAIHCFGAQRPGEALKLQRAFQLSDAQRSQLESARRGEFLLSAGPNRLALQVWAPDWQAEAMANARDPPTASV